MHVTYQNIQFYGHIGGGCNCIYPDILYQNEEICKLQNSYSHDILTDILFKKVYDILKIGTIHWINSKRHIRGEILLSHVDFSSFQYEPAQHMTPCKLIFKNNVWKKHSLFLWIMQTYKQNVSIPATQRRRKNRIPHQINHAKKP